MLDDSGVYLPDIFPEADRRGLRKYLGGPRPRFGLGERPALLVVDMTRGFVEDRFRTGWEETGVPCARHIQALLDVVRRYPIPVFFTKPMQATTIVERGLWVRALPGVTTFPPQPPDAFEIYPLLKPAAGEVVVEKQKPSAFFGTALHAMLTYQRVDTLIVTGMVTSGCVRATVNDAFSANFRCIVPIECVADRAQLSHEVNLADMSVKYADVLPVAAVLEDVAQWVKKAAL